MCVSITHEIHKITIAPHSSELILQYIKMEKHIYVWT